MEKKNQHIIPRSYLKAWIDPACPACHEPYIWLISKDRTEIRKRSPKKSFREPDFYTIKLKNGDRVLDIEDSLSLLEEQFASLRAKKVNLSKPLRRVDQAVLCVFAAMMASRTKTPRRNLSRSFNEIHQKTVELERSHNAPPLGSLETQIYAEHGHQLTLGYNIQTIAEWLSRMHLTIFVASGTSRFISSDDPCVWFNPESYRFPPLLRSPGLAQEKIEVTLPLSPTHFAYFSWTDLHEILGTPLDRKEELGVYLPIPDIILDEMNRRTTGYCDKFIVAQTAEIQDAWFNAGTEPTGSGDRIG